MFRVKKVLNHNTLIGIGMDDNREYLLIGKGIGFGRKISERIEVSENGTVYSLYEQTQRGVAAELVKGIDPVFLEIAEQILKESEKVLKGLRLYRDRARRKVHGDWGTVYVLTNHGTTMEQNLYRVNTLIDLGYCPYIMIFDKPNAPKEIKDLQRWCNRFVYKSEPDFYKYDPNWKKDKEDNDGQTSIDYPL